MYTPRLFFKSVFPSSNNLCHASTTAKLDIDKALLVSKLSHFEVERYKYKELNEKEFRHKLESRGSDYDRLYEAYTFHKNYETKMSHTLKCMGIDVRIVNRLNYNDNYVKWANVVIPIGGDGTFLLAASRVRDNVIPVIGFNSDPTRSEGHLCLPKEYTTNVEEAIRRLALGKFQWLLRSRIRITIVAHKGDIIPTHLHEVENELEMIPSKLREKGRILPYLALNEVFIGETLSARVSHLDLWLNDEDFATSFKSSGLCVSTGTGSTSWHLSINRLCVESVAELLRLHGKQDVDDKYATEITNLYNKNLLFTPKEVRMHYTVRDLISAGVWPKPKGIKSRDFAKRLKVKSKCFDASLVIDGGVSFAFNDGTIAVLEIQPEDALRTVQFVD